MLGEAQALVAEAPLRERRWALLALAQYQAGRQGDALRTLHQARRCWPTSSASSPAPTGRLEQAILRQDPSLVAAAALPEPSAVCPYRVWCPTTSTTPTASSAGTPRSTPAWAGWPRGVLAVVGPSGSGKSSLVRAGVAASLRRDGRRVVVVTPGARPMDALTALPSRARCRCWWSTSARRSSRSATTRRSEPAFFAALAAHAERGPLVLALRADRLGDLSAHPDFARLVEHGLHLLAP